MPRNVDLNLLPALHAILEEKSVTRGAARLGLSQPAMSASLGKLRRHFRDELLTRTGNVYELSLFHAERHFTDSNFRVDTTLAFTECGLVGPQ